MFLLYFIIKCVLVNLFSFCVGIEINILTIESTMDVIYDMH